MLGNVVNRLGIVSVLIVAFVVLSFLSPHFLTVSNLTNIMLQVAITTIIGVGMTFVILTGGIDLSVGSIVALCVVVMAVTHKALAPGDYGAAQGLVVIAFPMALSLLAGMTAGLVNGTMVAVARVPAFIMTLGMMSIARGLAYIISDNQTISVFPEGLKYLGDGRVFGFPVLVLASLLIVLLASIVLGQTMYGRYVYALGGNRVALRLSGINATAIEISVYVISGLSCGIAAIALLGRLNVAQPVAGLGYELDAIAAVIIGGTSIFGGEGRVFNTLLGALLVGIIRNGLNLLNVSPNVQLVVIGSIIVLAVFYDKLRNRAGA
ncbi:ABC transporter permease [Tropicimonas sp. IMCC6043]|uniref:ABC transporter permease n=1 Tax=Tropicimonas sp. IMCC6043 TaxID=2510645 RepID=UPI001A936D05|nr:ABC transporter permease [Tropicimonas sp. IMCC6043]